MTQVAKKKDRKRDRWDRLVHPLKKLRKAHGLSVDTLASLACDETGRSINRSVILRFEQWGNITIRSFLQIQDILPELNLEECRPRTRPATIRSSVVRKTMVPDSNRNDK